VKLSAQEEYGLRCLLQMARRGGESLTIAELARLEGISAPNAAKILRVLRRGGFVRSTRGQTGGYLLARSPLEINVGATLALLGGRLFDPGFCEKHSGMEPSCHHLSDCSIRSVWRLVQGAVDQVLGRMTLQDLLRSETEMAAFRSPHGVSLPVISGRVS
jgi:Rrf2 family protein